MAATTSFLLLLVAAVVCLVHGASLKQDEMELDLYARAIQFAREFLEEEKKENEKRIGLESRNVKMYTMKNKMKTLPYVEFRGKHAQFGEGVFEALAAFKAGTINFLELGLDLKMGSMEVTFTFGKAGHIADLNALYNAIPADKPRFVMYKFNGQICAMVTAFDSASIWQRMAISNYKTNFFGALETVLDWDIKFHHVFSGANDLAKIKDAGWLQNEIDNPKEKWVRTHFGDGVVIDVSGDEDIAKLQAIWKGKTLLDKWQGNA